MEAKEQIFQAKGTATKHSTDENTQAENNTIA